MSSHEQQIKCNHYVLDIFDGMHGFIPVQKKFLLQMIIMACFQKKYGKGVKVCKRFSL